jgi:hypothetical protein
MAEPRLPAGQQQEDCHSQLNDGILALLSLSFNQIDAKR